MKMPIKNMMVGVMYCSKPTVLSGNRVVEPLNSKSGITVAAPAPHSSNEEPQSLPNSAVPFASIKNKKIRFGKNAKKVSTESVSKAPKFKDFLIKL